MRATARGPARALVALATVATLLVAPSLSSGGGPDVASAAARPTPDGPGLRLKEQSTTVGPDGGFILIFDVADDVGAGSDFAIDLFPRIEDRAQAAAAAAGKPRGAIASFDPVPIGPATPGTQRSTGAVLQLDHPPGPFSYPLDTPGVYPLRVRLRRADRRPDEALVTYLVVDPAAGSSVESRPVALVTSLHQPIPAVGSPTFDGGAAGQAKALLDALATVPDLPLSMAVTPDTADLIDRDVDPGGLRNSLATVLAGDHRELLGAPYVPVDPPALVGHGLVDELARQASLGAEVLQRTFEPAATDTWMLPGPVDAATVRALDRLGVRHLLLPPSAAAVPATQPSRVPGATAARAIVLAATDQLDASDTTDPVLAAHQLVGRLAAEASLEPEGASVVRIDATDVDPAAAVTLISLLDRPPALLAPTTATALFDRTPAGPLTLHAPTSSTLGAYPAQNQATQAAVAAYTSMLAPTSPSRHEFDVEQARASSTDLRIAQRVARLRRVSAEVEDRLGRISVPPRDRVTLGARNATFPLPIRSGLDEPVTVVVELQASPRLTFPNDRLVVTLDDERTVVQVPVRVGAAGDTPLLIRVRTPDGRLIAESRYTVRATVVSGVGLLLTVGAAGFLALWWGRHWRRSRRARRRM